MPQYFDSSEQAVRERVRELMENATDENGQPLFPNQDAPGSPGYTIREMVVQLMKRQYSQLNRTLEDFSPRTAQGSVLDQWAGYFDMSRNEASDASGQARIEADVDGTTLERLTGTRTLPEGMQLSAGNTELQTTEPATIPEGDNSSVVGIRAVGIRQGRALQKGASLEVTGNDLLEATAITPIDGGQSRESDEQLRFRLARALRAPSTYEGLQAQMLGHEDVSEIEIDEAAYGPGTTEVFVKPAVAFPADTLRQELEALADAGPGEVFVTFPSYEGVSLRIRTTSPVPGAADVVSERVANIGAGERLIINDIEQAVRQRGVQDAQVVEIRRGEVGEDKTLTNARTVRQITNLEPKTSRHQWYARPKWIEICQ